MSRLQEAASCKEQSRQDSRERHHTVLAQGAGWHAAAVSHGPGQVRRVGAGEALYVSEVEALAAARVAAAMA